MNTYVREMNDFLAQSHLFLYICDYFRLTTITIMRKNKYLPLLIALIFGGVIASFFIGGDDGKYVVSYEAVPPVESYQPSKVKLYVENSGSMDGYMFDGSELKDAVYSYVSGLSTHSDTTEIYFVNSSVYRVNAPLQNVIYAMSPAVFHSSPGNKANTDIADIFGMVLSQIEENSVSVLVTDAILDLPAGASAFFHTKQTQIKSLFENYLKKNPNFAVEIYRMSSKFNGKYFFTGGSVVLNDQPRPYYMFVLGNKQALSSANRIVAKSQIQHGVENYYAYSSCTQVPFVVINKKKKGSKGNFEVRLQQKAVPVIANVDLQYTLHDDEVLETPLFYSVAFGDDSIKVKSIKKLLKEPDYTHAFTITLPENADEGNVNLYFCPPPYPIWLEDANDDLSDASVATSMKTTGIKYIVEGISDAFASTCVNNPAPFTNNGKVFVPSFDNKPMPVLAGWKFRLDKKGNAKKSDNSDKSEKKKSKKTNK